MESQSIVSPKNILQKIQTITKAFIQYCESNPTQINKQLIIYIKDKFTLVLSADPNGKNLLKADDLTIALQALNFKLTMIQDFKEFNDFIAELTFLVADYQATVTPAKLPIESSPSGSSRFPPDYLKVTSLGRNNAFILAANKKLLLVSQSGAFLAVVEDTEKDQAGKVLVISLKSPKIETKQLSCMTNTNLISLTPAEGHKILCLSSNGWIHSYVLSEAYFISTGIENPLNLLRKETFLDLAQDDELFWYSKQLFAINSHTITPPSSDKSHKGIIFCGQRPFFATHAALRLMHPKLSNQAEDKILDLKSMNKNLFLLRHRKTRELFKYVSIEKFDTVAKALIVETIFAFSQFAEIPHKIFVDEEVINHIPHFPYYPIKYAQFSSDLKYLLAVTHSSPDKEHPSTLYLCKLSPTLKPVIIKAFPNLYIIGEPIFSPDNQVAFVLIYELKTRSFYEEGAYFLYALTTASAEILHKISFDILDLEIGHPNNIHNIKLQFAEEGNSLFLLCNIKKDVSIQGLLGRFSFDQSGMSTNPDIKVQKL